MSTRTAQLSPNHLEGGGICCSVKEGDKRWGRGGLVFNVASPRASTGTKLCKAACIETLPMALQVSHVQIHPPPKQHLQMFWRKHRGEVKRGIPLCLVVPWGSLLLLPYQMNGQFSVQVVQALSLSPKLKVRITHLEKAIVSLKFLSFSTSSFLFLLCLANRTHGG